MSGFSGNPIYCVLLRLHRRFKVSIGLDEASFPSQWAYPYFHFSYTLHRLPDWGRRLIVVSPRLLLNRYHVVACTRRRTDGCGKSMLRSTVARLMRAPCKSSSVHRKICSVYGTTTLIVPYSNPPSRSGCSCWTTSSQNAIYLRARPGTKALSPAPASHAGACHGNRRSGHCIGSLNTSAQTENVGEEWRITHMSTHPRSSAKTCRGEDGIGRT